MNFCGKTATKVLADRKLQVLSLFLTSYIAISVVDNQIYSQFVVFLLYYTRILPPYYMYLLPCD